MSYELEQSHIDTLQLLPGKRSGPILSCFLCDFKYKKASENRILFGLDASRFYVIKPHRKKPEILIECFFLHLQKIISTEPGHVILRTKNYGSLTLNTQHSDDIINHLRQSIFADTFVGLDEKLNEIISVEVIPQERLTALVKSERPCGNFRNAYLYECEYLGVPVRKDIIYDVENMWALNGIRTFDMDEFDAPLSTMDIMALLGALCFNQYFDSIKLRSTKADRSVAQAVIYCVRVNVKMEELAISELQAPKDFFVDLFRELSENEQSALHILNLGNNRDLGDSGAMALSQWIGRMTHGLSILSLKNCAIKSRGVVNIAMALRKNIHMQNSLTHLDLSYNRLEGEASSALASFLAQANSLVTLRLCDAVANVEVILGALSRGTCQYLRELNLSYNKLTSVKTPQAFGMFIRSSTTLEKLYLDAMNMPMEMLKDVMQGLRSNAFLLKIRLGLSRNGFGLSAARIIASELLDLTNIDWLDLSDNEFEDEGICLLMQGIEKSALLCVDMSRTMPSKGSSLRGAAIEAISKTLAIGQLKLRSLTFRGGRNYQLGGSEWKKIFDLMVSSPLEHLDVSEQGIGNTGASSLGKLLQLNRSLVKLIWDGNGTTLQGFCSFCRGLKRNGTLKSMDLPFMDLEACMSGAKESERVLVLKVMKTMEEQMRRNNMSSFQSILPSKDLGTGYCSQRFYHMGRLESMERSLLNLKALGAHVTPKDELLVYEASHFDRFINVLNDKRTEWMERIKSDLNDRLKEVSSDFKKIVDGLMERFRVELCEVALNHCKVLDVDMKKAIKIGIDFGSKDVEKVMMDEILVLNPNRLLVEGVSESCSSAMDIVIDYCIEKIEQSLVESTDRLLQNNSMMNVGGGDGGVSPKSGRSQNISRGSSGRTLDVGMKIPIPKTPSTIWRTASTSSQNLSQMSMDSPQSSLMNALMSKESKEHLKVRKLSTSSPKLMNGEEFSVSSQVDEGDKVRTFEQVMNSEVLEHQLSLVKPMEDPRNHRVGGAMKRRLPTRRPIETGSFNMRKRAP